jgi:hypothetical protein
LDSDGVPELPDDFRNGILDWSRLADSATGAVGDSVSLEVSAGARPLSLSPPQLDRESDRFESCPRETSEGTQGRQRRRLRLLGADCGLENCLEHSPYAIIGQVLYLALRSTANVRILSLHIESAGSRLIQQCSLGT